MGGEGRGPEFQGHETPRRPRLEPPTGSWGSPPTLPPKALPEIANYFPIWKTSGEVATSNANAGGALVGKRGGGGPRGLFQLPPGGWKPREIWGGARRGVA